MPARAQERPRACELHATGRNARGQGADGHRSDVGPAGRRRHRREAEAGAVHLRVAKAGIALGIREPVVTWARRGGGRSCSLGRIHDNAAGRGMHAELG